MKYPDLKRAKNYPDEFKSGCHLHVGASCISLAPIFFKSQSALMPLRRMIAIVREARQRFYREKQGIA